MAKIDGEINDCILSNALLVFAHGGSDRVRSDGNQRRAGGDRADPVRRALYADAWNVGELLVERRHAVEEVQLPAAKARMSRLNRETDTAIPFHDCG